MLTSIRNPVILALIAGFVTCHGLSSTYTSCGVEHTLAQTPSRVVTMNQGVTEFMLAMGLADRLVGTAYLDDEIWPRYASDYATVPVLSDSYPSEDQIMAVNPDFVMGSYASAFRERTCSTTCRGIFSNETGIGPCEGSGSDWFETGSNTTTSYSTCRPNLHAAGIGTWLEPVSCEDRTLRPQGGATEETVYAVIRQLGEIFNVQPVANQLISEIRNDFYIAETTVASLPGAGLRAFWFDCVDCCDDGQMFVGAGTGAPNLIMKEAGMTNVFSELDGSWACVDIPTILAAHPDIMIVVDAAWDTAIGKIDFIHNHSAFCTASFVRRADYIRIPFSASTLGPRNGAAALDLVSAALHLMTGSVYMDFESGVSFFTPEMLMDRTAKLLCPITPDQTVDESSPSTVPGWAIAVIVVAVVLFVASAVFAVIMFRQERVGKPIFSNLKEVPTEAVYRKETSNAVPA